MFSIGQLWPVIVIMAFYPFGVYLAYIHFLTTLPRELIEAARIDGLNDVSIFLRVAAPLAKQAVALVVFFSFVATWTNYFLPLVLLPLSNQRPLSVGLQSLVSASPLFDPTTSAGLAVKLYMPQLALAYDRDHHPALHTVHRRPALPDARRRRRRGQGLGRGRRVPTREGSPTSERRQPGRTGEPRRVTQADVAARAGVSTSVVSRELVVVIRHCARGRRLAANASARRYRIPATPPATRPVHCGWHGHSPSACSCRISTTPSSAN